MAEDVELDQTAFDGVIIEMGCNDAAVLLVGRILDGREMMDVHITGMTMTPPGCWPVVFLMPVQPATRLLT